MKVEFFHTAQEGRRLYVVDSVMRMMKGLYPGSSSNVQIKKMSMQMVDKQGE